MQALAQSPATNKNKKMTYGQAMKMMTPFAELIVAANLTTQDTLVKGFNGLLSAASIGTTSAGVSIGQCMSQHLNAFSTSMDTSTELQNKREATAMTVNELQGNAKSAGCTFEGNFSRRNNVTNTHRAKKQRLKSSSEPKRTKGNAT